MKIEGSERSALGLARRLQHWLRAACLLLAIHLPVSAQEAGSAEIKPAGKGEVTLNFANADIDSVVGAIGAMTNRTFIVDPRVRGQITLSTPRPVSRDQAYQFLLSALRLQGFAVVENGRYARVVPEADAKLQGGRVNSGAATSSGDQIITQVIQLNYESATNLVPILRPLISPNNTLSAYGANNTLVITDYAENVQRIMRLIANIDVPAGVDLDIIPLHHAVAVDLASVVNRLLDDASRGGSPDAGQRVLLMAEPRTNSLLLRAASKQRADLARTLISRLDQPTQGSGNLWVVYLKNAESTKLAQTLRAIVSGDTSAPAASTSSSMSNSAGSNSNSGAGNNAAGNNAANTGGSFSSNSASSTLPAANGVAGMIQADATTNSLIITAPEPVYRNLREIIEKLDVRRAQVFIEALLVEVSSDKAAEFGVQWLTGATAGNATIVAGQVLGGAGSNLVSLVTNPASIGNGFSLGIVGKKITLPGIGEVNNLGFLARALETQGNANILSTPNLLTLDNEEAKIVVGQNVPFVTGQFTNTGAGGGTALNPFQTIERKDVGITLRVKPQVSDGGTVKLQVFQEVSSVIDRSLSTGLITNKRSIESNVVVDDGQIIVIGGLIEDRSGNAQDKVPGLGDLPGIGNLFRYDSRKQSKTNLMMFLRPVVIRNPDASNNVLADRYELLQKISRESQAPANWALPNYPMPVMAPLNENKTVPGVQPLIQHELKLDTLRSLDKN